MKLASPRFGAVSFTDEQILTFASGLMALPEAGRFVVIDDPECVPFQWLVSIERPDLAISVLDPAVVLNDASGPVHMTGNTKTFVVATPGSGAVAWWLDLRHPILINTAECTGEQVTLDDDTLPERFPVTLRQPHETAE